MNKLHFRPRVYWLPIISTTAPIFKRWRGINRSYLRFWKLLFAWSHSPDVRKALVICLLAVTAASLSSCAEYERWDAAHISNEAGSILLAQCRAGNAASCAYVRGEAVTIQNR